MSKVRVGIVGLGFGRSVLIPAFGLISDAEIVALASRRVEVAHSVADEHSIPHCFSTWNEMVAGSEIDAVCIATPPASHAEIALASLAAGKAVFCEKPLDVDSQGALRMWAAARDSGMVHAVDFEFREVPAWRFLKALLQDAAPGHLRHISITWTVSSWADPMRSWSWRSDRKAGGGVLSALGVHALDYIQWLFGPVHSVSAQLSTCISSRPMRDGTTQAVTAEDVCNVSMLLHDATPLTITISNVAASGRGHWIEVYGENRTLILGSENLSDYAAGFEIRMARKGERPQKLPIPDEFRIKGSYADGRVGPVFCLGARFIRSIRSERDSAMPSFEDGYRSQLLMDCIFQSSTSRQWVEIPTGAFCHST